MYRALTISSPEKAVRRRMLPGLLRCVTSRQMLALLPLAAFTVAGFLLMPHLEEWGTLGYAGVFGINLLGSGTLLLPTPGLVVAFVAAGVWNPFLIALMGAIGSTLGDLTGYLAGTASRKKLNGVAARNKWYGRIQKWMEHRGALTVFVLALVPNPFFDLAGLAAGSMGYPFRRFAVACLLGKSGKFLAVSLAGYWGSMVLAPLIGL